MAKRDFIVVGSGGGGGTIAWMLAKRGFSVLLLEQGGDPLERMDPARAFDASYHDEYRWRLKRPSPTRRPAWDYNVFYDPKDGNKIPPAPLQRTMGGWTNSVLGGGSVGWGLWALRPLPVDFKLGTFYGQSQPETGKALQELGYAVQDWPLAYSDLAPYYDVAETLFAVSGDRLAFKNSVVNSDWYKKLGFAGDPEFTRWENASPFPLPAYPTTPVGAVVAQGLKHSCPLPVAIVNPGSHPYHTREKLWDAWQKVGWEKPESMPGSAEELWSNRVREACNLCGYCGEFVCWGGHNGPKSGTRVTVLEELLSGSLPKVEVRTHAKAFQIVRDGTKASGVRYLDITDRDNPRYREESASNVILSCGAVQTARLLLLSGLGQDSPALGGHAMFHMFGLQSSAVFKDNYAGLLRQELGPTGNTASMSHYFVEGQLQGRKAWLKGGILVSSASKNPLEFVWGKADPNGKTPLRGSALLDAAKLNGLTVNLRVTGDDFPHPDNRVVLDPSYVDEFGFPVARIQRSQRALEIAVEDAILPSMEKAFDPIASSVNVGRSRMDLQLIGDHQMGTCRMGTDPKTSVVDSDCRLHALKNVLVVDTSVFPSGFGVNPMMTVVANALRVGSRL